MFIIWQKQEQFDSFHVTGLYFNADILLTNSDEPNLILPTLSRPLYFFSHQLFGPYRLNKYFQMKTVNDFAFYLATFSLHLKHYRSNCRSRWENLDRSQYPFQPIKFVNLVVPSPCETELYNNVF